MLPRTPSWPQGHLLAHGQPVVHQDTTALPCRASFQQVSALILMSASVLLFLKLLLSHHELPSSKFILYQPVTAHLISPRFSQACEFCIPSCSIAPQQNLLFIPIPPAALFFFPVQTFGPRQIFNHSFLHHPTVFFQNITFLKP